MIKLHLCIYLLRSVIKLTFINKKIQIWYTLLTTEFTFSKCTIWWFLVSSQVQETITTNYRMFLITLKRSLQSSALTTPPIPSIDLPTLDFSLCFGFGFIVIVFSCSFFEGEGVQHTRFLYVVQAGLNSKISLPSAEDYRYKPPHPYSLPFSPDSTPFCWWLH